MKTLAFILFTMTSFHAFSMNLEGSFKGIGAEREMSNSATEKKSIALSISLTDESLKLEICSEDVDEFKLLPCIYSEYEVEFESIYSKETHKKIGDIYPNKIVIFDSGEQVSEQFLIHIINEDQIKLNYSYSNIDGNFSNLYGPLTREP